MLSYIGGKARMANWISPFVPDDIETYVEVFGGAMWVYINSDIHERCEKIIYNDFNPYMVNLFRCASNPKTFKKYIDKKNPPLQTKGKPDLGPACHDFFDKYKKKLFWPDSAIKTLRRELKNENLKGDDRKAHNELLNAGRKQRQNHINEKRDVLSNKVKAGKKDQLAALKYAYILTCSFSGIDPVDSEFQDYKGKYGSKFKAFYNRLTSDKFIPKLKKIEQCENLSFEEVIKKYDSPTTYFYCDPPYWNTESYYSLHGFGKDEHYQLKDMLHKIQGKFSLSYYKFDELREMYSPNKFKWQKKEFVKPAGAKGGLKQSKGEEVLIMNYEKPLDKTE